MELRDTMPEDLWHSSFPILWNPFSGACAPQGRIGVMSPYDLRVGASAMRRHAIHDKFHGHGGMRRDGKRGKILDLGSLARALHSSPHFMKDFGDEA